MGSTSSSTMYCCHWTTFLELLHTPVAVPRGRDADAYGLVTCFFLFFLRHPTAVCVCFFCVCMHHNCKIYSTRGARSLQSTALRARPPLPAKLTREPASTPSTATESCLSRPATVTVSQHGFVLLVFSAVSVFLCFQYIPSYVQPETVAARRNVCFVGPTYVALVTYGARCCACGATGPFAACCTCNF